MEGGSKRVLYPASNKASSDLQVGPVAWSAVAWSVCCVACLLRGLLFCVPTFPNKSSTELPQMWVRECP